MSSDMPRTVQRRRFRDDERGLTPVVGTLLVLAITVIGMAAIMFWGAPTIERLRVSNTQATMLGEFEDIRQKAQELSVPDSARLPTINVAGGVIGLEEGSRFMITATFSDAAGLPAGCELHVTDWTSGNAHEAALGTATACGTIRDSGSCPGAPAANEACLRVYEVLGASLVEQSGVTITGSTIAVAGTDFQDPARNWLFRLTSDSTVSPDVFAEAWVFSSDRLYWRQGSSSGEFEAYYDSGALFSGRSGSLFLEERPIVQENIFGTGVFSFWLYTVQAINYQEITATGTYQVFLGLQSLHPRVQSLDVPFVRLDVAGELAEGWCTGLLVRNSFIGTNGVTTGYIEQTGFDCETGDADGVRSIKYDDPDPDFPFQLIHAKLRAAVQV